MFGWLIFFKIVNYWKNCYFILGFMNKDCFRILTARFYPYFLLIHRYTEPNAPSPSLS